uniref:EamA domain-containing protein n=1 Tax=Geospiza parvula TaxID=87175 RepID=A0A8C3QCL4_GEOPR
MAWSRYQLGLAALMLLTGSINTLAAKWADNFSAPGCDGTEEHKFQHPFLQAAGMFLGEFSCLPVFYLLLLRDRRRADRDRDRDRDRDPSPALSPSRPFNALLFLPPALCDMAGTSIMYVALNMTSASSFQMLRGSLIIFTGLLSVAFLGRRLEWSHWAGILLTILGLALVGLADLRGNPGGTGHGLADVITGDLLILLAQAIVSIQMVLEEKFVFSHDVHPLRAVGTEGLFGFSILALLLVPLSFIPAGRLSGNPRGVLEDPMDAWCQIRRDPLILAALLGNIGSISFFNFAGLSVTRELSATTRTVLDSLRTLLVWALSLALRWERFHALQVPGFALLLAGPRSTTACTAGCCGAPGIPGTAGAAAGRGKRCWEGTEMAATSRDERGFLGIGILAIGIGNCPCGECQLCRLFPVGYGPRVGSPEASAPFVGIGVELGLDWDWDWELSPQGMSARGGEAVPALPGGIRTHNRLCWSLCPIPRGLGLDWDWNRIRINLGLDWDGFGAGSTPFPTHVPNKAPLPLPWGSLGGSCGNLRILTGGKGHGLSQHDLPLGMFPGSGNCPHRECQPGVERLCWLFLVGCGPTTGSAGASAPFPGDWGGIGTGFGSG